MKIAECYNNLVQILEEEITVYRHFLDLVRHEYNILLESKLEALVENNQAKDAMIVKLKSLERIRDKRAKDLTIAVGAQAAIVNNEPLTLMQLASKLDMDMGDRLRSIHATLDLLIKRVRENNTKNEALVQSALTNIKGALENLKHSLQDKKTYKSEGKVNEGPVAPGRFVSKEV
jgi:flagellar biosynthesis/type III secretory pathway chaperone